MFRFSFLRLDHEAKYTGTFGIHVARVFFVQMVESQKFRDCYDWSRNRSLSWALGKIMKQANQPIIETKKFNRRLFKPIKTETRATSLFCWSNFPYIWPTYSSPVYLASWLAWRGVFLCKPGICFPVWNPHRAAKNKTKICTFHRPSLSSKHTNSTRVGPSLDSFNFPFLLLQLLAVHMFFAVPEVI